MATPGLQMQSQNQFVLVPETVPGVYNSAATPLSCPDWRPDWQAAAEFERFRAAGRNADSWSAKTYGQVNVPGDFKPCYNEMDKWLAGLCGDPIIDTTAMGIRHREYIMPDKGRRSIVTYTGDWGTEDSVIRTPMGLITGFSLSVDPQAGTQGNVSMAFRDPTEFDVPMTGGVNAQKTLTSTATGGTFKITVTNPNTGISAQTAAIAYNATAAVILAAIVALGNVASDDVTASGGPLSTTPVVLTFHADYGAKAVASFTIDNALATGGTVVSANTTPGVEPSITENDSVPILSDHWALYRSNDPADLSGVIDEEFYIPEADMFEFSIANLVNMHRSLNRTRSFSNFVDADNLEVTGSLRAPTKNAHVISMLADIEAYISGAAWHMWEAACPDGAHLFQIKWRAAVGDNVPFATNNNVYERMFPLNRIIDPGNLNGGSLRFITEVPV